MKPGEAWLRERVAGAPPALMRSMVAALPDEAATDAEALAEGALTLYRSVGNGGGGREDALPLLAADALLTHAFEAQAQIEPSALPRLAERFGARGRLRELMSRLGEDSPAGSSDAPGDEDRS